jgi:hypothetical protein
VKQETKVLFEGNDRLRKIANTLTDIGARVDVLRQGAGVKKKKKGGMIDEENDETFRNPVRIARRRRTPPPPPPPPPSSPADDEANKENIPPPNPNIQRGRGIKKSPVNNIGMANSWIEYVKAYAKKNNMKYNEALKDPKMKAGYKKGGKFDLLKSITDVGTKAGEPFKATTGLNPFTFGYDLGHDVIGPALMGRGMPTSRDEYISQLYDQANLGANGRVRLN